MASTEVQKGEAVEPAAHVTPPMLSIIVPVYNGSRKIESTLEQIKTQIEKLQPVIAKLDVRPEQGKSIVNTGRKVVENAGAAMLLDEYLSKNPQAIPAALAMSDDQASRSDWYEIIVVNDGSKDDTRHIVQRISSADQTIRLISYSVNMGKGYAIRQGVLHSHGKYVMFLDGDGEISTEVLSKYLQRMNSADIVIGSKYHPQSVISVPASRKFFSKCFHIFVKVALGIKVSDTQVGLKVGKGDAFRKIFQRIIVKRYAFDAEMIAVADLLQLRIVELPVKIDLDKSFKKKEIVKMAVDVLGVAFRLRLIKWYQKNMEKQRPTYRPLMFA
jgi:dolichol-phosphate mannosyltransferase